MGKNFSRFLEKKSNKSTLSKPCPIFGHEFGQGFQKAVKASRLKIMSAGLSF
jgi:hypothetical protein